MSDLDIIQNHFKRGGPAGRSVVAAARRVANRYARLNRATAVQMSPWMLSLLRLDRNGNERKR